MRTYYTDPSIRITDGGVFCGNAHYALADIESVWQGPQQRDGQLLRRGLALAAAVVVLAGCSGGPVALVFTFQHGWRGYVLGAIAFCMGFVVAVTIVSAIFAALNRHREIRVVWRGSERVLYATDDPSRCGQAYRALVRAVENRDDA